MRALPEIGMCMVYRPRPARVVTLNPTSWLLLEACNGATVDEIEGVYSGILKSKGHVLHDGEARVGLESLLALSLVRICEHSSTDQTMNQE